MLEALFFLLPVAAVSGYWLGSRRRRQNSKPFCTFDPAYIKGLNYVISDQPDKAIDVFVKLLEVDSETIETHFALGYLFRRRGEMERAIRIHQNLIARQNLSPEESAQGILELGLDYLHAGVLDRAEDLFRELVEQDRFRVHALSHLRLLYEKEREWQKSLEVSLALQREGRSNLSLAVAHYCCELAELAFVGEDPQAAMQWLDKARETRLRVVRVHLLYGRYHMQRQDFRSALSELHRAVETDPAFIGELLPFIAECYRQQGRGAELSGYLAETYRRTGELAVLVPLTDHLLDDGRQDEALQLATAYLDREPTLVGLMHWLMLSQQSSPTESDPQLRALSGWVKTICAGCARYRCEQCGHETNQLHWQCAGCKSWGTVRPLH